MSRPLADLRAFLFDLDGTLIETHLDFSAMARVVRQQAQEAGVSEELVSGRDILAVVEAAAADVSARGGDGASYRRAAFAQLEAMEVAGCARPALLPGACDLLTYLRHEGIKVGIVTRNCRAVAAPLLARYDLPYDVLLTRDDVARAKPHPEHLWHALRLLDTAPAEAAMVGDHVMDICAGRDAGCAVTIGVLGSHDADWFSTCPPAIRADSLAAVRRLLTE